MDFYAKPFRRVWRSLKTLFEIWLNVRDRTKWMRVEFIKRTTSGVLKNFEMDIQWERGVRLQG